MEIETDPNRIDRALVTFEDPYERHAFGENAPLLNIERWRSKAWDFQGLRLFSMPSSMYWHKEFPQTVQCSYNLVGNIACSLAERRDADTQHDVIQANMLATITDHLRERKISLPAIFS